MTGRVQSTTGAVLRLRIALLLVGVTAVVGQIVLLREVLVASLGNELSLGLTLTIWLLWTAAGSGLLGRLFRRADPLRVLAFLQAAVALALPLAIYLARLSRTWWNLAPGEPLGPLGILLTAAVTLFAFCPLTGWLFAAGTRAWQNVVGSDAAAGCNAMYLYEAAGSALGGVLASVLLLRAASAAQIAVILAALNLICGTWIALQRRVRRWAVAAVILAACALAFAYAPRLELQTVSLAWRGFQTISMRNSPYGSLTVVENEGSRSALQNGVVLFTSPDVPSAEEAVHFAMLQHPAARTVLLIGGGFNGSLAEILKYPSVTSVAYVEPDPALFGVAHDYFPQEWARLQADGRVHFHAVDARLYVKSSGRKFDVVLLSLPEPQTAQLNRFYTEEFFHEAAGRLNPGGVLAFHVRGAEEYLSPQRAEFLRCLQATLSRAFSQTAVVPGETVHFLATNAQSALTLDPQVLVQRLKERGIQTSYVSEYYLPYRLMPERVASVREQIEAPPGTRVNRDFSPIAYYFGVALWSTQFRTGSRAAFALAQQVPFGAILAGALALTLLLAFCYAPRQQCARAAAGFAVASTGLTLMAVEILLLLGFQAIYGYVFDELAVIVAAFMAGLGVGAWLTKRASTTSERPLVRRLLALQVGMLAAPLVATGMLVGSADLGATMLRLIAHIAIPALAVACGVAGGTQFALATRVWLAADQGSAGGFYGLDLMGAAAGAAFLSIYLLPVFGFAQTTALIAIVNAGPTLLLVIALRRSRGSVHWAAAG